MRLLLILLPTVAIIAALSCAAGERGSGGGGATATGTGGNEGGSTSTGGFAGGLDHGGAEPLPSEVFGHSADQLYKLDPTTHEVTVIGPITGCTNVIDLAIDKDRNIFATSYEGLHRIDPVTADCTLIATGTYPNSLSFIPEGTLDPTEEALVGYLEADYVRIDRNSGQITTLMLDAIGSGYISSGDVVSVIGGGTYLTIKGSDCSDTDCLIEIDPVTGALVRFWGHLPYDQVFGLAFWAGSAFGFTNSGDLFEITFDADSVHTTPIDIPDKPEDLSFWGAGSTTAAPLTPT